MTRCVALLGSINAGGNRLRMADLRAALEDEGFENLATVTASGNVLFDSPEAGDEALETQVARIVKERFGIDTFATVRTAAELGAALAQSPFVGEGEDRMVHVHFLVGQPSDSQFERLIDDHAGRGPERLSAGTRCLHVDYVGGAGTSRLTGAFIEKRLGCRGTARNVRSIRRIINAMEET